MVLMRITLYCCYNKQTQINAKITCVNFTPYIYIYIYAVHTLKVEYRLRLYMTDIAAASDLYTVIRSKHIWRVM